VCDIIIFGMMQHINKTMEDTFNSNTMVINSFGDILEIR